MRAWKYICLVAFAVLANYCYFQSIGLYEDDFSVVSAYWDWGPEPCLERSRVFFLNFSQGRPLSFIVCLWLGALAGKMGTLQVLHLASAAIVGANTLLMYRLCRKIWNNPDFAILASLLLVLFPADKIRPCAHAVYVVQGGLGLFLVCCNLLLSRRRAPLAYLGIGLGLLLYELFFPQIFFFPLLVPPDRRGIGLKRHWVISGFMFLFYVALRKATGDERVQQLVLDDVLQRVAFNIGYGPPTSLFSFATCLGPGSHWIGTHPFSALGALLMLLVFFPDERSMKSAVRPQHLRLLGGSLLLMLCGYAMALTTPGDAVVGRATRVHSAAAFPWALALSYLGVSVRARLPREVWNGAALAYLLALFGSNVALQRGYAVCWQKQQVLWTELVRIWPQPQSGIQDVIFLQANNLAPDEEMQIAPWSLPLISAQLVKATDRQPPIVMRNYDSLDKVKSLDELSAHCDFLWLGKPAYIRYFYAQPQGNHLKLFAPQLQGEAILAWKPVEPTPQWNWKKLGLYDQLIVRNPARGASPFLP